MLRLKNLSNKYQKRLIRPIYAHTQATPYATSLDDTFRNTDGSIRKPLAADSTGGGYPLTRSADAYTLKSSLTPGLVLVKVKASEKVAIANGANAAIKPFGLLANFVGGDLDDLGDENYVGAWRGPDAVFELLAPAYDDTGLAAAVTATSAGVPVKLYAGTDGRLTSTSPGGSAIAVADLIERSSATRIVIDLLI